ncbi:hypothetical protein ABH924_001294 [Arthrobacter sp. GAS37]
MSVEALVTDREVVAERLRGQVTNLEQVRFEAFRQSLARCDWGTTISRPTSTSFTCSVVSRM